MLKSILKTKFKIKKILSHGKKKEKEKNLIRPIYTDLLYFKI